MNSNFLKVTLASVVAAVGFTVFGAANGKVGGDISKARIFVQPIVSLEGIPAATDRDTQELQSLVAQVQADPSNIEARFESFLSQFPGSSWAPSIRAGLAVSYRSQGRYTKALDHWAKAWAEVKGSESASGRAVGDFILTNWLRLLASLGRVEDLEKIIGETKGRNFENPIHQRSYSEVADAVGFMKAEPGKTFKCGVFALGHIARALGNSSAAELVMMPSPATGFSMTALEKIGKERGLDLVAVERPEGAGLIVPSLVHWRQNHYAAILAEKNGRYRVADPTFGGEQWLTADVITEEASGNFLMLASDRPSNWRILAQSKTDRIFGKGYPNVSPPPPGDCPEEEEEDTEQGHDETAHASSECPECPAGGPGSSGSPGGSGSGGSGGGGCRGCLAGSPSKAMATWMVREPTISLLLEDIPMFYPTTRGGEFKLRLKYDQREPRAEDTNVFGFGQHWNCNWLSYIDILDPDGFYFATNYVAGGGQRQFSYYYPVDERSHVQFEQVLAGGILTNVLLKFRNGAVAKYGAVEELSSTPSIKRVYLLERVSPNGFTNRFEYAVSGGQTLLTNVVDVDGRNTRLFYHPNFSNQVSVVSNSFGHTVQLFYNSTNRLLTNIVDTVGISSQFEYVISNSFPLVTALSTPYGRTTFQFEGPDTVDNLLSNEVNFADINRAITVTEPTGAKHLYLYRDDSEELRNPVSSVLEPFIPRYYDSAPSWFSYEFDLCNDYMFYRNSFYWGPNQYLNLSTTTLTNLSQQDYELARLRNYLHGDMLDVNYTVSFTLNMERDPASGTTNALVPGGKTWYGYTGKGYSNWEGDNSMPSVIARLEPDDFTVAYQHFTYNEFGNVTNKAESYTLDFLSGWFGVGERTTRYEFAGNGRYLAREIRLEDGVEVLVRSNVFNASFQVVTNYNALMEPTTYEYDSKGYLVRKVLPSGMITTNVYSSQGYLIQVIDQVQSSPLILRTSSYSYLNGRVHVTTNELGLITTNYWDALGRLTGRTYPDGSSISNVFTVQAALPYGTGTQLVDLTGTKARYPSNAWTWYGYDGSRHRIAETNALGNFTLYNYCVCGGLNSVQDMTGNLTEYFRDNSGRVTGIKYPGGSTATNHYNILGQLTNTVETVGNVSVSTTNWYNNQGLLVLSSNDFGQIRNLTYDIDDRVTNSVDQNGVFVDITYDDLDRVSTRTNADGGVEQFFYSARGLTNYVNQLGQSTFYAYNEAGWKRFETNAKGNYLQFEYDAAGNLKKLYDERQNTTTWNYDQYGRVTNKVDDLSNVNFRYGYNEAGWLTNRWTPAKGGLITVFHYDSIGNLTKVVYPSATNIFQYDAMSRLTNMVDSSGQTKFSYSAFGALLSEDGPWAEDTVAYTLVDQRRRSMMSIEAPNGSPWTEAYTIDSIARLSSIVSDAGTFTYSYANGVSGTATPSQLVTQLILGNGSYITNQFDMMGRLLVTQLRTSDGTVTNSHSYAYNEASQRTNHVRFKGDYVRYAYDPIGQLTNALAKEQSGIDRLHEQLIYRYDAAGNLLARTNNGFGAIYQYNDLNQLTASARMTTNFTVAGTTTSEATSVTVNGQSASLYADATFAKSGLSLPTSTTTFTAVAADAQGRQSTDSVTVNMPLVVGGGSPYDLNGNLTTDGRRLFFYDDENQLTRVIVTNQWKSEFTYDAKMRRRIRKEFTWSTNVSDWVQTNEVRYVYSGKLVVQERDENNLPKVTYTRGTDFSGLIEGAGGISGLLARTSFLGMEKESAIYHADGNGNVTTLLDENEQIAARYVYDPFGNVLSKSGQLADANLYRFSSKEAHENSGLVYYLYRYYDPNLQRWINRDPKGERAGFNLYAFVFNRPVGIIDSYGLEPHYPGAADGYNPYPPIPNYDHWGPEDTDNNCYNYARDCHTLDDPSVPPYWQPNGLSAPVNCQDLVDAVEKDGNTSPMDCDGSCPEGYHRIRPWASPNGDDFHFYRQDAGGSWSHKRGEHPAEPVTNPNNYFGGDGTKYTKCNDICVKNQVPRSFRK